MQIQITFIGDSHDANTTTRAVRFQQALQTRLARDFGPGIAGLVIPSESAGNADTTPAADKP